jgi:hypothetical protein
MTNLRPHTATKPRRNARIDSTLPTCINGVEGVTRDVSTSGLFILQSHHQEIGSRIDFSVDLDTPGGKLKLCCVGEVVRLEEIDGKFGIGIKIINQVMKSYS